MSPRLQILVVDDIDANRTLIARFVKTLGHDAVCASNGVEAIAACTRQLPDLVLMDVMMPEMDGHEAAHAIRELCAGRWLPIIFLSAKSSEAEQLEGLTVGDDYLTKPVNLAMLRARIEVMARINAMQQRIVDNTVRLEAYRAHNELELGFTQHVLDHLMGYRACAACPVKRWIKPARQVSGDVIAQDYSPSGALHVLLADSTGHGLAAAMSAVPAVDTFHAMTRRGFGIASIVRELNAKLHHLLPADRFVAAAVVAIDAYRREITVWNGGIPAVLFATDDGVIAHDWPSRHPPLAILADHEFDPALETWRWTEEGSLTLCSDGILEAENLCGEPFGHTRLVDAIARCSSGHSHGAIIDAVTAHLAQGDSHDDLALASIACSSALHQPIEGGLPPLDTPRFAQSNWDLRLRFDVSEIRQQVVPQLLTRWLNQFSLNSTQFGHLQLILNELCNNAIDHGVLELDSSLKLRDDGYEAYRQARTSRLAHLTSGSVEVSVSQQVCDGARHLQLRVSDSGRGFDHAALMVADAQTKNLLPYGRGISLVRGLASALRFGCNGAEAIVDYAL